MDKNTKPKDRKKQEKLVAQAQTANHWAVAKYLQEISFSPRLIGVDEADVWKKMEKLCELYENALTEVRGNAKDRIDG